MIDYEKLKQICDLANQLDGQIYFDIQYRDQNFHLQFNNLDDLINKLKELTKSKPNYEVGQRVWFLEYREDKPYIGSFVLDEWHFQKTWRNWEDDYYPSREDLIQSQIDFWTSLQNEEKSTDSKNMSNDNINIDHSQFANPECNHISEDGVIWRKGWDNNQETYYECKFCGELFECKK